MASRQQGNEWVVIATLVGVQVVFGLHYLAAKLVLAEVPPRAWALARIAGAAVVLLACVRLAGRRLPRQPAVLGRLALFAVFGVVINQLCFVEGLSRTTPTHSALINTTIPVNTLLFAVVLGRERLRWRKLAALGVAFAGVLLVIRPGSADVPDVMQLGDLLTLINSVSFSFFLVVSKRLLGRVDPLAATAVLMAFGALGIAMMGLPQLLEVSPAELSARTWWLALFIVLLPTAGAYLANYWALARVDSSMVAFFIFLQPAIAAGLSATVLGERLEAAVIGGAALIFAGVILALWKRPPTGERPTTDR